MPIAFHPDPVPDDDVTGSSTEEADAAQSPGARRRDPLTERILARGDASVSAVTYDSTTDGDQFDLADRQALRRVGGLSTELELSLIHI